MLVDHQIRAAITAGDITVEPFDPDRIQPASLDVCLGDTFATFTWRGDDIDPKVDIARDMAYVTVAAPNVFTLHPGELVLAATAEKIGLATTMVARIEGKSSLGRLGLLVHQTAGFIDPGWLSAAITLELTNVNSRPIRLYPGMPIAQLAFEQVAEVETAYRGKYVGQGAPTPSRYHRNFD